MTDMNPIDNMVTDALDNIASRKAIKHILKAQHAEEKARKKAAKKLRKRVATSYGFSVQAVSAEDFPQFRLEGDAKSLALFHSALANFLHQMAVRTKAFRSGHDPLLLGEVAVGAISTDSAAHLLEACSMRHFDIAAWYSRKLDKPDSQPPT